MDPTTYETPQKVLEDWNAVSELVKHCDSYEGFASLLFHFFESHGKGKDLLLWAIKREVENTS